jgi:prevent-host-death family protein
MAQTVNIYEAKAKLSALIEAAKNGEEIIIAKAGEPQARLIPFVDLKQPKARRPFGQNYAGITYVAPDAFDPLPDEDWDSPLFPDDPNS